MSGSLLTQEAAADAYYGFPPGTLEALAATESGNGANTGTIGNVFQILPSTAANPGYGLGPLNGNDPYSAGAYLAALQQGPAGGNLATALAMYHGGAGNPTPYGAGTPIANFLAGAGTAGGMYNEYGPNGNWIGMTNDLPLAQQMDPGNTFVPTGQTPVSGAGSPLGSIFGTNSSSSLTWYEELAIRLMLVLVGIALIAGGFVVAAHRSAGASTLPQIASALKGLAA